jgi:hypothetical protein
LNTTETDPLTHLAASEEAFQEARTLLQSAEAKRYAAIWAALTAAEDMAELRAALPATVTTASLRAAVRRHATGETGYISPNSSMPTTGPRSARASSEHTVRAMRFSAESPCSTIDYISGFLIVQCPDWCGAHPGCLHRGVLSGERGADFAGRKLTESCDAVLSFAERLESLDAIGDLCLGFPDRQSRCKYVDDCLLNASLPFTGLGQTLPADLASAGRGLGAFSRLSGLLEYVHDRHGNRALKPLTST